VKVHLALSYTDMWKGMDGLAMLVQETLKKDPFIHVGRGYVAARPDSAQLRGDGGLCRT